MFSDVLGVPKKYTSVVKHDSKLDTENLEVPVFALSMSWLRLEFMKID